MADIGYLVLVLALLASVYAAIAFVFGLRHGHGLLAESGRSSFLTVCGLIMLAVALLLPALLAPDCRIDLVDLLVQQSRYACLVPSQRSVGW